MSLRIAHGPIAAATAPPAAFLTEEWTGNGTSPRNISNNVFFTPRTALVKKVSASQAPAFRDAITGILFTTSPGAAAVATDWISGFSNYYVQVGSELNASAASYTGWLWREAAGLYTKAAWSGNTASNRSINHSLGAVPELIIVKARNQTGDWYVWHKDGAGDNFSVGDTGGYLRLNSPNASASQNNFFGALPTYQPTSSVFTVTGLLNSASTQYDAYVFAGDGVTSKFGSYVGNGVSGASGIEVTLGFMPKAVFVKAAKGTTTSPSPGTTNWFCTDDGAWSGNFNVGFSFSQTDASINGSLTKLSAGFRTNSDRMEVNGSGVIYVYGAWA